MWNLDDKTALVTGGTKGIGRAIVKELLSLKAKVIFTARNNDDILAFEKELLNQDLIAYGFCGDVSKEEDLNKLANFVSHKFEKLDILVNNAGINIRKNATAYTSAEYRKVLEINLIAPFELSRKLYPLLKKSGKASVINIASVAANQDVKSGAPYGMAKSGLLQQTRSLAAEWAIDNIRVNAVSPWYTETPLTEAVFNQKDRLAHIISRTPMQRVAQPEEMAGAVAFLAMDKASYITGQNLVVDGGISISAL
ncbi:SDR family oxidoreductase [Leeuwenhoekiella sp. A16]|uniref:SDR family oxidoreductase n=1 Tax=unclassified Leeuwenhoekiella TaxID=2615029 RepID=UPI003A809080|tara:strand:+ start:31700 stop:32458 length:759 start_codon:yes stop_codon:yes gene_type:complete